MESPAIHASPSLLFRHQNPKLDASLLSYPSHFIHNNPNKHATSPSTQNKLSISTKSTNNSSSPLLDNDKHPQKNWIHFVGVGGCGISALAMLALKQGNEVSGSDIAWSSFMDRLNEAGARLYVGHSVSNIQRNDMLGSGKCVLPDALVVSSAIPEDNVEVLHAKAMGIPVYKRDVWLEMTTKHYNLIAVSGTHGKSTTAGLLVYVLSAMGDDLTAIIGAHVPQFSGGNMLWGHSPNFVLEADEYDGCFLHLSPYIAIVTNVEWEHVDIYQDEEAVKDSFRKFLKKIRVGGHLIICGDSEGAASLLNHTRTGTVPVAGYKVTTYGMSNSNEWYASSVSQNSRGGTDYVLYHMGHEVADISLQLSGVHNVCNSLAVIATVRALMNDIMPSQKLINCIRMHLNNFMGLSRRFEMIGSFNGCHIFDDYAHHPTEVQAVIQATCQRFPHKALLVVFQPHTFSRLATFMKEFSTAFHGADRVIVTEVYASRELDGWNVSGRDLSLSITGPVSEYIPLLADVINKLALEISSNPDRELVLLTLGAGDVTSVGPKLLQTLQQEPWYRTGTRAEVINQGFRNAMLADIK